MTYGFYFSQVTVGNIYSRKIQEKMIIRGMEEKSNSLYFNFFVVPFNNFYFYMFCNIHDISVQYYNNLQTKYTYIWEHVNTFFFFLLVR